MIHVLNRCFREPRHYTETWCTTKNSCITMHGVVDKRASTAGECCVSRIPQAHHLAKLERREESTRESIRFPGATRKPSCRGSRWRPHRRPSTWPRALWFNRCRHDLRLHAVSMNLEPFTSAACPSPPLSDQLLRCGLGFWGSQ